MVENQAAAVGIPAFFQQAAIELVGLLADLAFQRIAFFGR